MNIKDWAKSIEKHEGFFPGSRSFRNNNPGNFRCSSFMIELGAIRCDDNFSVFQNYEIGFQALIQFLTYAVEGKLRSYKPEMTLYEFYAVYAPSGDGNAPKKYAEAIAKDLGVSAKTKIKDLFSSVSPSGYYSQRDKRWADDILGFGKTRLGTHGCFVTSLGNLCGKTPREVNHILQKGKFFNGDLIISSEVMAKSLGLTYAGRSDKQPKYRCIAEVDMSPAPGKQQHFILIKEDGSIIDSWTGTIRPKGTYPIVSYRLFRAVEAPKEKSDTKVPLSPENAPNDEITTVESIPQEVEVVNNQPQEPIMQIQNSFDKVTLIKIGKGALIAGGGALAIYFLQAVVQMDFGTATPLIVALASIAINAIKEYKAGV